MSEASDALEERTKTIHGDSVSDYLKKTSCYYQDGDYRCGPMGNPAEVELHHRMLAAAQQLEQDAIRDDSGAIDNPNLAAARHDLYQAIYTSETAIGSDNLEFAQFGGDADYENKTGLSESDIEARYTPSMEGTVGNICPETGTDPGTSIMKSLNQAAHNMGHARHDGEPSVIVRSWWLVNDSLDINDSIRKNDEHNPLNAVDQSDTATQGPENAQGQRKAQGEDPEQLEREDNLDLSPDNGEEKKKKTSGMDLDPGI